MITGVTGVVVASVTAAFTAVQNRRTRVAQQELEEQKAQIRRLELAERQRHDEERTFDRYREPLLLAANDLGGRIDNIRTGGLLGLMGMSDRRDALILRGTAFRVAQYFAIVESLYPKLGSTLAKGDTETQEIAGILGRIGRTFATDSLDQSGSDGPCFMLWREEQRAIGGLMLAQMLSQPTEGQLSCLGYASFLDRYDRDFEPWLGAFVEDLQLPGVVSSARFAALQKLLASLVVRLDTKRAFVEFDGAGRVVGPSWIARESSTS